MCIGGPQSVFLVLLLLQLFVVCSVHSHEEHALAIEEKNPPGLIDLAEPRKLPWYIRLTKTNGKLFSRRRFSEDEERHEEISKPAKREIETKKLRFASFRRNRTKTRVAESESPGGTNANRTSNAPEGGERGRKRTKRKKLEERKAVALMKLQHCREQMVASPLRSWQRLLRRGRTIEADVKIAYQMAVLASVAYWDFHKRKMPENASGFRLVGKSRTPSLKDRDRSIKFKLCRYKRRIFSLRYKVGELLLGPFGQLEKPAVCKGHESQSISSCDPIVRLEKPEHRRYNFDYFLYDWNEPTAVPGVKYHDTDLLVSTAGDEILALSFAGTASVADHFTNAQTFEPAVHSGIFNGGGYAKNATIRGSLHRGFLNAYSRVEIGSVLRLCQNCTVNSVMSHEDDAKRLTRSLYRRYGNCTGEPKSKQKKRTAQDASVAENTSTPGQNTTETTRDGRKTVGCRIRNEKLMNVLRELVIDALSSGRTVHLTGHSLGGGIASLLALDVIMNFPEVPVSKLFIWTFGAPQVVDDVFLRSAIEVAPRLRLFVEKGRRKKRFRRFVTLSDDCKVDIVTTVAEKALPSHKQNLRGHAARALGGVRGNIIHFADPHYLLTPDQHEANETFTQAGGVLPKTTTRSTLSAHFVTNYLRGISRESKDHPLSTDLPSEVREWIGEVLAVNSTVDNRDEEKII